MDDAMRVIGTNENYASVHKEPGEMPERYTIAQAELHSGLIKANVYMKVFAPRTVVYR